MVIPAGIDVKIAEEAFGQLGYRTVFRKIDWEKKDELVESGKIDCIWGCFSMEGRSQVTNGQDLIWSVIR